jgi:glucosylceramidase
LLLTFALALAVTTANLVIPHVTAKYGARIKEMPGIEWTAAQDCGTHCVHIDRSQHFQRILGFGSALTESAAFSYMNLNTTMRSLLIELLFDAAPKGNNFNMARMHLDSADFSLSTYNLDNVTGDTELTHFDDNLSYESKFVLPFALNALKASSAAGSPLKIFFSPWSPPGWMKQSGSMINTSQPTGILADPAVHKSWAQYMVRYAKALTYKGLKPWGMTIQNEPLMVMTNPTHLYEACAYSAADMRDFLRDFLGPELASAGLSELVVMAYDWNKGETASYMKTILEDPMARQFLGGVAVHWYAWRSSLYLDQLAALTELPNWDKSLTLLATEACYIKQGIAENEGSAPNDGTGVLLGPGPPPGVGSVVTDYAVGELYLLDAVGDIRFGSSGWIDWNACLSYNGGPNHINRSDISAPILVDTETNSLYVQSMYYYIGSLSRFVPPGWHMVSVSGTGLAVTPSDYNSVKNHIRQNLPNPPAPPAWVPLVAAAFSSPDLTQGTLVVMNVLSQPTKLVVADTTLGSFNYTLPSRSVVTFTF